MGGKSLDLGMRSVLDATRIVEVDDRFETNESGSAKAAD